MALCKATVDGMSGFSMYFPEDTGKEITINEAYEFTKEDGTSITLYAHTRSKVKLPDGMFYEITFKKWPKWCK